MIPELENLSSNFTYAKHIYNWTDGIYTNSEVDENGNLREILCIGLVYIENKYKLFLQGY